MKHLRYLYYTRLARANSIIAAFIFGVVFYPISPIAAWIIGGMFLLIALGIIPIPSGVLGENITIDEEKLLEKVAKKANEALEQHYAKFETLLGGSEMVKGLKSAVDGMLAAKTDEQVAAIKAQAEELAIKVKSYKEALTAKKVRNKTYADYIMKGIKGIGVDKLKALKDNKNLSQAFRIGRKVDNPMTEGVSVIPITGGAPAFGLTQFEPGLLDVSRRKTYIVELINVARTISEYVAWAEKTNITPGVAGMTAEGATKTVGSFRWTENKAQVETMTYFIKISKRMLDDLQIIEGEIRGELMEVLNHKLDYQTVFGNGTSPQLKGITQYAQAFSNFSGLSVPAANDADALMAAILQIRANGTLLNSEEMINIYEPTDIVLNPADYLQMKITKDSFNRYLLDIIPDLEAGGKFLDGLRITTNVAIPSGKYLVMDAKKSNLRIREDANITIGYENDDFTKNLVTILGEMRACHYIKNNHVNAFVYDSFATTISLINKV